VKVAATRQTADTQVGVGRTAVSTNRVTGALECVEGDEHVGGALENFEGVALERNGAIRSASAFAVKVFRPWVHGVGGCLTSGQVLACTDAGRCVKVALLGGVIAAREFGGGAEHIVVIGGEELGRAACSPTRAANLVAYLPSPSTHNVVTTSGPGTDGINTALGMWITSLCADSNNRRRGKIKKTWLSGHEGDDAGEESSFHAR
jgi:hypothetical protein